MASNNPSITAADIITDVEARLGTPGISTTNYLPWVSYAYQKTFQALINAGQTVKEELFGNYSAITLTNGTAEYALSTIIPRFGGFIKTEILYGGTGDQRVRINKLRSVSQWQIQGNVSTSYRSKSEPLFYLLEDTLGVIPTPPVADVANAILYAWYVRRPYQINLSTDVIDIDYRFIYPIVNYVQAKAIQAKFEDYSEARTVEAQFQQELEQIAIAAASEYNENDETNAVEISADSMLFDNPLR